VPKAAYSDFLTQNPNCKKFTDDEDMIYAFNMLSGDIFLIQLLEASDFGKPAIAPIVTDIEHVFMDLGKKHANTLDDNFTKQAVGLMVKTILEPFGYSVWKQKDLPKNSRAEKLQTASVYHRDMTKTATLRVKKTIEEV
jgi:hypothetical protein